MPGQLNLHSSRSWHCVCHLPCRRIRSKCVKVLLTTSMGSFSSVLVDTRHQSHLVEPEGLLHRSGPAPMLASWIRCSSLCLEDRGCEIGQVLEALQPHTRSGALPLPGSSRRAPQRQRPRIRTKVRQTKQCPPPTRLQRPHSGHAVCIHWKPKHHGTKTLTSILETGAVCTYTHVFAAAFATGNLQQRGFRRTKLVFGEVIRSTV